MAVGWPASSRKHCVGIPALRTARRACRAKPVPTRFYQAGGFPADNPWAHVLPDTDGAGRGVYRVVVSSFAFRAEAEAEATELRASLGAEVPPHQL